MSSGTCLSHRVWGYSLFALVLPILASAQQPAATAPLPLGSPPPQTAFPRLEFAFEFRVTLAPAVVLGNTPFGHRQYIPITGGKISGPKFTGEVLPGGWDFQLGLTNGCSALSADYFIRADDGTVIHVLNQGMGCAPGKPGAPRSYFRPQFEAPKGTYDWLTRGTFVASLELDPSPPKTAGGASRALNAIRLKFYQVE